MNQKKTVAKPKVEAEMLNPCHVLTLFTVGLLGLPARASFAGRKSNVGNIFDELGALLELRSAPGDRTGPELLRSEGLSPNGGTEAANFWLYA